MANLSRLKTKKKIMKLDNVDLNILGLLRQNARFTIKEIARKLKISREVVQYKIKNYEKRGLIKRWAVILNYKFLNLQEYGVNIFLNYSCPTSIPQKLEKIKNIIYIDTSNFDSILLLTIVVKNLDEFENVISKIKKICGKNIKNISISVVLKEFKGVSGVFPEINITKNYSRTSFQKEFLSKKELFSIEMIKPIHYRILDILIKDCREPIISIAEKANISINTTIKRIKELIKWGIIVGYITIPNYSILDVRGALIYIKTKPCGSEEEKELENYFRKSHIINWCIKYIGNFNYEVEIFYKDYNTILEFIEEFKTKFLDRIETLDFISKDKTYVNREYSPY